MWGVCLVVAFFSHLIDVVTWEWSLHAAGVRPVEMSPDMRKLQDIIPEENQSYKSRNNLITLSETNIAPENRPKPNRKGSYSNHPFLGAKMVVSGRVGVKKNWFVTGTSLKRVGDTPEEGEVLKVMQEMRRKSLWEKHQFSFYTPPKFNRLVEDDPFLFGSKPIFRDENVKLQECTRKIQKTESWTPKPKDSQHSQQLDTGLVIGECQDPVVPKCSKFYI